MKVVKDALKLPEDGTRPFLVPPAALAYVELVVSWHTLSHHTCLVATLPCITIQSAWCAVPDPTPATCDTHQQTLRWLPEATWCVWAGSCQSLVKGLGLLAAGLLVERAGQSFGEKSVCDVLL